MHSCPHDFAVEARVDRMQEARLSLIGTQPFRSAARQVFVGPPLLLIRWMREAAGGHREQALISYKAPTILWRLILLARVLNRFQCRCITNTLL